MQSCIFLCLSQATINFECCGRKSIQRRMGRTYGGGLLIGPDGVASTRTVGVSASCYPPWHHKVQKKLSCGTGSPGGPGNRAVKRLWWCGGGATNYSNIMQSLRRDYRRRVINRRRYLQSGQTQPVNERHCHCGVH